MTGIEIAQIMKFFIFRNNASPYVNLCACAIFCCEVQSSPHTMVMQNEDCLAGKVN